MRLVCAKIQRAAQKRTFYDTIRYTIDDLHWKTDRLSNCQFNDLTSVSATRMWQRNSREGQCDTRATEDNIRIRES